MSRGSETVAEEPAEEPIEEPPGESVSSIPSQSARSTERGLRSDLLARIWETLTRRPRRTLIGLLVVSAVLRLPFAWTPLESDEGGFLMVAEQWHGRGVGLYTDQWVDRPPLLLVVFKLAAVWGSERIVVRLISFFFGCVLVVSAYFAGRIINGSRGAVAAAVVATFVSAAYSYHGFALTGEAIAGAFVMASCAVLLQARYGDVTPSDRVWLALTAGVLACLAALTKQNFLDAGVFALALLMVAPLRNWRLIIAYGVGVALPLAGTVTWALTDGGPGLQRLWVALFRFRQRSLNVIEDASLVAPLERLQVLLTLFLVTGLAMLVWQTVTAARRAEGRASLRFALAGMLGYVAFSIAAGASWWTHYLLQLGPVLAMGAALASTRALPAWRRYGPATWTAVASVISAGFGIQSVANHELPAQNDQTVADYLRAASDPGDSVVLAYGSANVIQASELTTPYRYSWSLPIRTRDPNLTLLVDTLNGPNAPTWLVEIGDFDWWDLDNAAFEQARSDHYRVVATVCGHDIYLHADEQRPTVPTPSC